MREAVKEIEEFANGLEQSILTVFYRAAIKTLDGAKGVYVAR